MPELQVTYHAFSHPNQPPPRRMNEDALLAVAGVRQGQVSHAGRISADQPRLFAVSDGVHTSPQAARASQTLLSCLEKIWKADPELPPGKKLRQPQQDYADAVATHPDRVGMSCTLIAAELRGRRASIYHVGDSRAWHIREEQATCLTRDHTQLESLIRASEIPRSRAHEYASIYSALERCFVASADEERPDYDHCHITLAHGDTLMLASDGLSVLADRAIAAPLNSDLLSSAKALFNAAVDAGSDDNITMILIRPYAGGKN